MKIIHILLINFFLFSTATLQAARRPTLLCDAYFRKVEKFESRADEVVRTLEKVKKRILMERSKNETTEVEYLQSGFINSKNVSSLSKDERKQLLAEINFMLDKLEVIKGHETQNDSFKSGHQLEILRGEEVQEFLGDVAKSEIHNTINFYTSPGFLFSKRFITYSGQALTRLGFGTLASTGLAFATDSLSIFLIGIMSTIIYESSKFNRGDISFDKFKKTVNNLFDRDLDNFLNIKGSIKKNYSDAKEKGFKETFSEKLKLKKGQPIRNSVRVMRYVFGKIIFIIGRSVQFIKYKVEGKQYDSVTYFSVNLKTIGATQMAFSKAKRKESSEIFESVQVPHAMQSRSETDLYLDTLLTYTLNDGKFLSNDGHELEHLKLLWSDIILNNENDQGSILPKDSLAELDPVELKIKSLFFYDEFQIPTLINYYGFEQIDDIQSSSKKPISGELEYQF